YRNNFVFEEIVNDAGMESVLVLRVALPIADGPAARILVAFIEPAVQNAEVEHAVTGRFHAAGAAGLFAAARGVQPNIDALDHFARHLHVVVLEEDYVLPKFRIAGELYDFTDVTLAGLVLGMRL